MELHNFLITTLCIVITIPILVAVIGISINLRDRFQAQLELQRLARLPHRDPDDIQQIIAELLVVGIQVGFDNDACLVFVNQETDLYQLERVLPGEAWTTSTETFVESEDAARRFLEVRAHLDSPVIQTEPEENDYERFYSYERAVLRNLFDNMKLDNGKTVTQELSRISSTSYADKSRFINSTYKLDDESWLSLVEKIKTITRG